MREVPGSIPDKGPRNTKDVKKYHCLALNIKRETLTFSLKAKNNNTIFEGLMED